MKHVMAGPVAGRIGTIGGGGGRGGLEPEAGDLFGRIVAIMKQNERLIADLDGTREQAAEAFQYLEKPGANRGLARAQIGRLRSKRSGLLAMLRANRIEALSILGHLEAAA